MNAAEQLRFYREIGLDVYVPVDFDETLLARSPHALGQSLVDASTETPVSELPQDNAAIVAAESSPKAIIALEEAQSSSLQAPEPSLSVNSVVNSLANAKNTLATDVTPPEIPAPVAMVTPFNWLVARGGFVNFVCDIKQPRLAGVWHGAALELLTDIAIAMGDPQPLTADYFSWPLAPELNLSDADLHDFLTSYLSKPQSRPIYICLGDVATTQLADLALSDAQKMSGDALGVLFKSAESKRNLWQQLKPWVRR